MGIHFYSKVEISARFINRHSEVKLKVDGMKQKMFEIETDYTRLKTKAQFLQILWTAFRVFAPSNDIFLIHGHIGGQPGEISRLLKRTS